MIKRTSLRPLLTSIAACLAATAGARASTLSWDGGDATNNGTFGGTGIWDLTTVDWTSAIPSEINWSDASATGVDTAVFGGTAGTVTLNANLSALGLSFTTTGYTINGTKTLTLGSGGIDASTLSSGTVTLGNAITLAAAQTWNVGTGASLADSGTITTGGFTLTKSGGGSAIFSGSLFGSGALAVNAGLLTLSGNNSSLTGNISVGAATLNINNANALGTGTLSTSATGVVLDNTSGAAVTLATNNPVTLGNDLTFAGTNNLTFGTGTVTMLAARTVTVNAGVLTFGGNIVGNTFRLTKAGNGTLVVTGNITNTTGGITQNAGTMTLTGTNSFTGTLIVNGGTLNINGGTTTGNTTGNNQFQIANVGGATGVINVNGGTLTTGTSEMWVGQGGNTSTATLNLQSGTINVGNWFTMGRNGSTGTFNMSGGTFNKTGGGNIDIGSGGGAAGNGTLNQSGGTLNSTGSDILIGETGGAVGTYNVSGTAVANIPVLNIGTVGGGTGTVNLNGGTINATQVIKGGGTGTINFNGGTLAARTGANTTFLNGLTAANVRNGGAIINTNGLNITIGQVLQHSTIGGDNAIDGGLTKQGNGVLTLTGASTYTGTTTVSGGSLTYGANNVLPIAAPVSVAGGTLDIGTFTATTGDVTLSSGTITGTTGVLTGTSYTANNTTGTTTVNAILGGTGINFTKTGAGTVTLNGANTYTGTTIINGGTVSLGSLGSLATGSSVTIGAGTLDLRNGFGTRAQSITNLTLNGGSTLLFGLGGTSTDSLNVFGTTTILGSDIIKLTGSAQSGTYNLLTTTGLSGTLTLDTSSLVTGFTTYTGAIVGNNYQLTVNAAPTPATAFWKGTVSGIWSDASLAPTSNWSTNAAGTADAHQVPGNISDVTFVAAGAGNTNTTLGTDFTIHSLTFSSGTSTVGGSNALTIVGTNANGNAVEVQSGATATLSVASASYNGPTVVNSGGTLTATAGALGGQGGPLLVNGTLNVNGDNTNGDLNGSGAINKTNAGNATLTIGTAADSVFSGPIGNSSGSLAITKLGAGALTLSGANSFSGGVNFTAGTLNINSATAIGTGTLTIAGAAIDNTSGAAVTLTTNNPQNWNNDFTFNGSNSLNLGTGAITLSGNRTLTINGTATLTAGGNIIGNSALTKLGTGALTLGGNYTTTGSLLVNGGTLNIPSGTVTGRIGGNSPIQIANVPGTTATVTVSGTGTLTSGDSEFWVGQGGNTSTATLNLQGGTINVGNWFTMGRNGSTGTFNMSGGTLNKTGGGNIDIASGGGAAGTGVLNQSGGTINDTASDLLIGEVGGANGAYNVSGTAVGNFGHINIGTSGGATGTMNLDGGTVNATQVFQGGGAATLNFNGGTLKASAGANAAFLTGIGTTNVRNGGAVFDTGGQNITIAQALQHSAINGDNAIDGGLTKNGNGVLTLTGANNYTGATTVNAGTLTYGGNNILPISAPVAVSGGTLDIGTFTATVGDVTLNSGTINGTTGLLTGTSYTVTNTTGTATVNATLAGFGVNLTKSGAGTLALNAANTYSGVTTINGGTVTLGVNGSLDPTSSLTIGAGTFDLRNGSGTRTQNITNLVLNGGSTLVFGLGGTSTDVINVSGVAQITGSNTIKLSGSVMSGTYNLITTFAPLTGTFVLDTSSLVTGFTHYAGAISGDNYQLTVNANATPAIAYWKGTVSSVWSDASLAPTSNWTTDAGGTTDAHQVPGNTSDVIFVSTGASHTTTTLGTDFAIQSLTFASGNSTVGGANALTIGGTNFGGNALEVQAGATATLSANSVTFTGPVAVDTGGTLTAASSNLGAATGALRVDGTLNISGDLTKGDLSGAGTISKSNTGSATLTVGSVADTIFSGVVQNGSGTVGLTKAGSGALTLSGANTYTGGTNLTGGTLNINNASAIGTGPLTISNGSIIDNTSGAPVTLTANNAQNWNADFSFGGSNDLNLGTGAVTLSANRVLSINGTSTLTVGGNINGNFGLSKLGTGTLTLGGNFSTSGTLLVNGGTLNIVSGTVTGTIGGNNPIRIANDAGTTATLTVSGSGTLTSGDSEIYVGQGGNTATATLNLMTGGTINANNWFAIGRNGSTGTLNMTGGTINKTGNGNFDIGPGGGTGGTGIVNQRAGTINDTTSDLLLGEVGGGNGTYNVSGTAIGNFGRINIGTSAGGTGTVNLDGGVVNATQIIQGAGTATLNFNGGTLVASVGANAAFLTGLTTANVRDGGAIIDTGTQNITIGQALQHSVINGDNGLDGGLTKKGNGSLNLSATNGYTGPTMVKAGQLFISGSVSGSSVTVTGANATLGGTGLVFSPVTVQNGGIVAPGLGAGSTGILTVSSVTFDSTSKLSIEIDGLTVGTNYSQLDVNGPISLANATLSLSGSYLTAPAVTNDLFFILLNGSGSAVSGTFAGLPNGSHVFSSSGQNFIISYAANAGTNSFTGGTDIALLAVPEPGSAAALLTGAGLLLGLRRRRR